MLLLGFLFCKHLTDDHKTNAIWSIINNEFKETVSKERVKRLLEDLLGFAVDSPTAYYSFQEVRDSNMADYLKDMNEAKKQLIDDTLVILQQNVKKDEFLRMMVSFTINLKANLIVKRMVHYLRDQSASFPSPCKGMRLHS